MGNRVGDYIETYSGKMFYPLDPRPNEISLVDIAHGSSLMCRFGGQCRYFYSIGQHAINVANEVKRLTHKWNWNEEDSIKAQLIAILHDSSEVLGIADICSPAKRYMEEYKAIEAKVQDAVWKAFEIEFDIEDKEYRLVDMVDKAMAAYEAEYLMNCIHWDISESYLVNLANMKKEELEHIDLSLRDMEDVEKSFFQKAQYLIKRNQEFDCEV